MTRPSFSKPRQGQGGVSILAAIFILLLLSALAAMMVSLTTTSSATSTQDFQGSRAYQAARAGVEWGLYQVMDPTNATATSAAAALPVCFASPAAIAAIPGFSVSVTCGASDYQEGSRNLRIYQITARATAAGPGGGIEREITVSAEKCRDTASTVAPYDCL